MNDQKTSGPEKQTSGIAPHIAGVLCYLCPPFTSLIFILIEKEDKTVIFHAWQGVALGVSFILLFFAIQILSAIMGAIASVLGIIVGFALPMLWLAGFALMLICLIKSYQGDRWKIPVLGDFAAKQAGL